MITFKITLISKGLGLVLKLTLPVLVIQSKPNDDVQKSMFRANWPFVGKLMVSVLGAVHMSRASPANRADLILSRPMVA